MPWIRKRRSVQKEAAMDPTKNLNIVPMAEDNPVQALLVLLEDGIVAVRDARGRVQRLTSMVDEHSPEVFIPVGK